MKRLTGLHAMILMAIAVTMLIPTNAVAQESPTYTKDIAPIFREKCEGCHRPGYIAPMSLQTYQEVRPWARSIKNRVEARQMPPWHIDQNVGIQDFDNDRSLSREQIALVGQWVDNGSPRGNPADLPEPAVFADDDVWNFAELFGGAPDLIIHSTPYTTPAVAQDRWWKPEVPTGLTEDRWIKAIEIRPSTVDGRRVTHHALAILQQEEEDGALGAASDVGPGLLMEWAVGKQGEIMRENSGKLIKADSSIIFDIHYHAVGEEITDTVELGLYLYPKDAPPKHRQVLSAFSSIEGGSFGKFLSIPPNQVTATEYHHVLKQNGRVENYQPHMHLRGQGMQMTAILPDGSTRVLSRVSDFNFNWHNNYVYSDLSAPLLPKGTVLQFKSWYDNTTAKRSNPDPNQWVGYGDRTVDEMGHAWVNITYFDDEDFETAVAEREQLLAANDDDGGQ